VITALTAPVRTDISIDKSGGYTIPTNGGSSGSSIYSYIDQFGKFWRCALLNKDLNFTNVDVLATMFESYTASLGTSTIHYVLGLPLDKLDLTALFLASVDGSLVNSLITTAITPVVDYNCLDVVLGPRFVSSQLDPNLIVVGIRRVITGLTAPVRADISIDKSGGRPPQPTVEAEA